MFNIFQKKQQVKIDEEVEKPIEYFYYEPLDMACYNTFALVEKSQSEITCMNVTKDCIIEKYLLLSYYKNNRDKICGKVFAYEGDDIDA